MKFHHLRHLQLFMFSHFEDVDEILYLISFLRATPFIEKLEVHVSGICYIPMFNTMSFLPLFYWSPAFTYIELLKVSHVVLFPVYPIP